MSADYDESSPRKRGCQEILTTLLYANRHNASTFVRELVAVTPEEDATCDHLGLRAAIATYRMYIDRPAMERVVAYEEDYKDYQKVQSAHAIFGRDLCKSLSDHRTWTTWWNT